MKSVFLPLLSQRIRLCAVLILSVTIACAQKAADVRIVRNDEAHKADVFINNQLFTTFCYPDTLEKPVLYPVYAAGGSMVTRGYPPLPGEPVDHPHHIGIWFNYESVNGLDFWNNSAAIAPEKKSHYGWIKTDSITHTSSGRKGVLAYHSKWTTQDNQVLLDENTRLVFSGSGSQRTIDRITTLTARESITMKDVKDGLLGMRVTRALQMYTPVKNRAAGADSSGVAESGNYVSAEGKRGDSVWGSRAAWCMLYGKVGDDSVSIVIMDHPRNINYPAFWHARGYGLFAVNPLGESAFTNGKTALNLQLKPGESVTFRYRIVISNGNKSLSPKQAAQLHKAFAAKE